MRITRSTAVERAAATASAPPAGWRHRELLALAVVSVVCLAGLALVYAAKTGAASAGASAARGAVNLNTVDRPEQLLPALERVVGDTGERRFVAERIVAWIEGGDGGRRRINGVGALGAIRVTEADLGRTRRLPSFRERLAANKAGQRAAAAEGTGAASIPLLTPPQLAALRPALSVRGPADFRRTVIWATLIFLAGFYVAHAWMSLRGSTADQVLLPAIQLLCGIGLVMMVSLRDPVRDPMLVARFAQGTAAGCLALAAIVLVDFQRSPLRRLSYVPLIGAVMLSALLIVFGSGPGTSDAKVNLLGVQPVEGIRLLVVLFLAGYFSQRWEFLRELKEPRLGRSVPGIDVPRLDYVLPVVVGMALVLLFFFLQKDLGPALVLACVFLAMYGVARGRAIMVAVGLALLVAGFAAGYAVGFPHTVVQRIQMWSSPWSNAVRGGDQLAHAFWALGTGGVTGTGLGLGDPQFVPAAHTDLVLTAVGEELGFVGLLAVLAISGLLAWRASRIALRAPGDYTFFLALGLTLSIVLQLLLIAAGLLGLMPLTGVATPFLSYGRSSMIANFMAFGVLLAISARSPRGRELAEFVRPTRWVALALGAVLLLIAGRAAFLQVIRSDRAASSPVLAVQGDGVRRFQYNPRLLAVAAQITRGTVTDRNGIPLATSRPSDLQAHAAELARLGAKPPEGCANDGARCYPFGGLTYHLLGDWRTQVDWAASNTSFVERDNDARLRGYDDHARVVEVADQRTGTTTRVLRRDLRELVPLLRYRRRPDHAVVKAILARPRDVRLSIDVRLQVRAGALVRSAMEQGGHRKGAAIVMAEDGDILSAVSYPWPDLQPAGQASMAVDTAPAGTDERLLDRVRYGVYPPGSSFKLVTATAALRKDPALLNHTFACVPLGEGGRVGQRIPGWSRPVRDDVEDRNAHGVLALERALVVSCNAYFAQLGLLVGAPALQETAALYEIPLGHPETARQVRETLPFAAYGQGQVLASPFKMARVAATIANGGKMPQGRWVLDETNRRTDAPREVLPTVLSTVLARAMRGVVLEGTGRVLRDLQPAVAGKTGTAEVQNKPSHSWFVGFAPYRGTGRQIAFSVIVENGGYGARTAGPIAGALVAAARDLGLIRAQEK